MKKLLLSLLAVSALAFTTQAQTEKGNFVVGGAVQFNTGKVDGAAKSNKTFQIEPSAGYFIANDIAVGTGIGYQFAKSYTTISSASTSAFVVSPFARAYRGLNDQFKFFGQLSVPMAFGNNKIVNDNGDTGARVASTTSIGVNIAPGFAFFPTKRIGIEVSVNGLGYNNLNVKNEITGGEVSSNSFGLEANTFAPKLGVQFHF